MNEERKRWQMAVGTPVPQTARQGGETEERYERDNTLSEFGRCAVTLRNVLYQDRSLDEAEFSFMDNHFQVLQMAYLRWKRKHELMGN
jgi:hypothetical protein